MNNPDLLIYVVHGAFWGCFGLVRLFARGVADAPAGTAHNAPVAEREHVAAFSRLVLAFHVIAFAIMYFGIGAAVLGNRVPTWFVGGD